MLALSAPFDPWHRDPRPEDDQRVRLYSAALQAIQLLTRGWTRQLTRCDIDTYEPSVVRYHLLHWQELTARSNGMSSPGAEPIGTAGEVDARRTLITIKSDLEQGSDWGLATILNWRQSQRIYARQDRSPRYETLRGTFMATWRYSLTPEPSAPLAEAICIERISRCLGWYPHAICKTA